MRLLLLFDFVMGDGDGVYFLILLNACLLGEWLRFGFCWGVIIFFLTCGVVLFGV